MPRYSYSRSISAAIARSEREAKRALRELEKQRKEAEKLSQIGAAKFEVRAHEGEIAVLLSLHKDSALLVDWFSLASALRPPEPSRVASAESRHWRLRRVMNPLEPSENPPPVMIEQGQGEAHVLFEKQISAWSSSRSLARKVIAGESEAYAAAMNELSHLDECSQFGIGIELSVHTPRFLEAEVTVSDSSIIPSVTKTLTASGKLSTKPMPKSRFNELFQDYVCSAMLRIGRECFAVLPIETLLLTAQAPIFNGASGKDEIHPVYSAILTRDGLNRLNFERLDPSDAIESFPHRGDFKASRKSGAFQPISPYGADDLEIQREAKESIPAIRARIASLRRELEENSGRETDRATELEAAS